ncbi:GDSL-type esterase/lipase family protein [Aestuariivirga sp.]|uniref:SGNH/GDSL hydrolase family protein n=1 Tax=Aestuariivirga sp. TaxID=2650926 RepID=UPI003BAB8AA8
MRIGALIAFALLLGLAPAQAQGVDAPAAGAPAASTDPDAPLTEEKHVNQVLVIGDAMGGGLGAGLTRVAEPGGDYDVSLRFNEESGLARPEVYDWAATVPKILESGQYDDIVVMLGANDRQTIRDGEQRLEFGTEAWSAAYKKQIDLLLDQLAASGARIVWTSPPPMKDPDYDAAMKTIAALQRERVEARGMSFLDLRPALSNPDGSYTDVMKDDTGNVTKLRGRDGISFFKAGNNLMGQLVLAAIQTEPAAPAAAKSAVESNSAGKTDAEQTQRQVPLFGQALMDQEPYTVQPEGVTANAMLIASGGLDPAAALKTLRDLARDGSGAAGLFKRGQPGPAPAGRADDFAAPAPQ